MASRKKLVEDINLLGPWVHGFFDLGNGITIKDTDTYQQTRLFQIRRLLIDVIESHFGKRKLADKSICDVGCNAGYFLFELYKYFDFGKATGFDPRATNIAKAKFIAKQFGLPKDRYDVSVGNVYDMSKKSFDVVIMPGVMHHLDDHVLACKRLFDLTSDLLIVETMAIPEALENAELAKSLELKDDIYKTTKPIFGVAGYKLESDFLDGATARSGIVSIPSKHAVYLMLFNAGFRDIQLFDVEVTSPADGVQPKYRDFCSVMAVAKKPKTAEKDFFKENTAIAQNAEIDVVVPLETIEPLFHVVEGRKSPEELTGEARLAWYLLIRPDSSKAGGEMSQLVGKPYVGILRTLAHQPLDKIRLEYGKTLFDLGNASEAKRVLKAVINTLNCDWRSVYRGYHLLSKIAIAENRHSEALKFNSKALKAHPNFFPALSLKESLTIRS